MWTLSGILFSLTFPWGKGNRIMRSCSLADAFSQVPLYLRQTVITVTAIPKDQTSAYTIRQQITLFSKVNPDVLVHESSHAQVILPPMRCSCECGSAASHPWEALRGPDRPLIGLRHMRPPHEGLVCRTAGSPANRHGSR